MSFFEDQLPYVFILRDYQTIFKEYSSLIICRETFTNSANNVLLDLLNTSILFLGVYDLILKGWFRHQGRKKSMRNHLKIELAKFLMQKWLILLCNMRLLQYDL